MNHCGRVQTLLLPTSLSLTATRTGLNLFNYSFIIYLKFIYNLFIIIYLFFIPNTFSSCTTCVSSEFPCDWCVDRHQCTHDTTDKCRHDILFSFVFFGFAFLCAGTTSWSYRAVSGRVLVQDLTSVRGC